MAPGDRGARVRILLFRRLNEYFLAEEQSERRRFFQTPPNVFDSFRLSETHWSRPPALDDLEEEAERLNSQLAELIDRLKGKHQAQAELTKRLENRICELEQQSSELAEKRKAILLLEEELEGLQLRFSESQEACSGLQSELQGVLSSRSWKITRPLRALRSKVKPRG